LDRPWPRLAAAAFIVGCAASHAGPVDAGSVDVGELAPFDAGGDAGTERPDSGGCGGETFLDLGWTTEAGEHRHFCLGALRLARHYGSSDAPEEDYCRHESTGVLLDIEHFQIAIGAAASELRDLTRVASIEIGIGDRTTGEQYSARCPSTLIRADHIDQVCEAEVIAPCDLFRTASSGDARLTLTHLRFAGRVSDEARPSRDDCLEVP
jgi:hypothetical protein